MRCIILARLRRYETNIRWKHSSVQEQPTIEAIRRVARSRPSRTRSNAMLLFAQRCQRMRRPHHVAVAAVACKNTSSPNAGQSHVDEVYLAPSMQSCRRRKRASERASHASKLMHSGSWYIALEKSKPFSQFAMQAPPRLGSTHRQTLLYGGILVSRECTRRTTLDSHTRNRQTAAQKSTSPRAPSALHWALHEAHHSELH